MSESKEQIRADIVSMLQRTPKPESIATYNQAIKFKQLADKAKKLAKSGNLEAITSIRNELRLFYGG